MAQQRNALKVGVVTVVVVATFFVILLWISKGVGGRMQEITIRFKSSPAMPTLAPGSAILVGGLRAGKVLEAKLDQQPVANPKTAQTESACFVVVTAELSADLTLRGDYQAVAEGPPLGGDGVVKLDLGNTGEPIKKGQVLEGAEPGGFGAILAMLQGEFDGTNPDSLLGQIKSQLDPDGSKSLMSKIIQSMNDINIVTATLGKQLGEAEKDTLLAKLHETLDNINTTTAALRVEFSSQQPNVLLGKVHLAMDAINDDLDTLTTLLKTNEPAITRTLKHVESTAENVARETDPARADSLMAHFKKASEQLNEALDDINTVTDTTRQVVVLNRENLNKMLTNFKEASDHLKTGVKYVLRHPWWLLNKPSPTELRQLAVFNAARSFAEAAGQIDDASARLKALADVHEGNIPIDNPDLKTIQDDLKRTREQYQNAEAELWRQLNVQ